jgi:hypothetical protein
VALLLLLLLQVEGHPHAGLRLLCCRIDRALHPLHVLEHGAELLLVACLVCHHLSQLHLQLRRGLSPTSLGHGLVLLRVGVPRGGLCAIRFLHGQVSLGACGGLSGGPGGQVVRATNDGSGAIIEAERPRQLV